MAEASSAATAGPHSTSPEAVEAPEHVGTFASLRVRNFRLLLIGTTLSNAGQWIQQITLNWLIFDMTGSGVMLGTINLVRSIATVGLAPISGVIIDRFPRRKLMILINLWLLCASATLGLVLLTGHREVWYLFVFTFFGGIAQVLDMPLRQTVVFILVPRNLVPNAVALVQTGWGVMRSLGPAVGGFFILWFGPGGNFLLQATAYALIAFNTLRIQFPPHEPSGRSMRHFSANLREGIAYVASEPVTRTFLLLGWIMPLLIIPNFSALPPIYAKNVFHGGPQVLGLLLSSVGIGGIVGGLVAASISRVERRGILQIAAMTMLCVSLITFAHMETLPMAAFFLGCAGFCEMIFLTGNQTLLQLSIPDELRGRVTAITTLSSGLMPVGAVVAGAGSDFFGPRNVTIVLCSIAASLAVATLLFVPTVRNYRLSSAIAREAVVSR